MNVRAIAEVLCRRLHPAEWDAPRPREIPCTDCFGHAGALFAAIPPRAVQIPESGPGARVLPTVGPIMHIVEPSPPPQVIPVATRCPACGYLPRRSYA